MGDSSSKTLHLNGCKIEFLQTSNVTAEFVISITKITDSMRHRIVVQCSRSEILRKVIVNATGLIIRHLEEPGNPGNQEKW